MNKVPIVIVVAVIGLAYWAYKGVQTFQAYQLAVAEIADREEIKEALGAYTISYDWWFGAFRVFRYEKVQEFEFHLNGEFDNAVSAVNLRRDAGWEITCVNVVNGEYLNNHLIHDC